MQTDSPVTYFRPRNRTNLVAHYYAAQQVVDERKKLGGARGCISGTIRSPSRKGVVLISVLRCSAKFLQWGWAAAASANQLEYHHSGHKRHTFPLMIAWWNACRALGTLSMLFTYVHRRSRSSSSSNSNSVWSAAHFNTEKNSVLWRTSEDSLKSMYHEPRKEKRFAPSFLHFPFFRFSRFLLLDLSIHITWIGQRIPAKIPSSSHRWLQPPPVERRDRNFRHPNLYHSNRLKALIDR